MRGILALVFGLSVLYLGLGYIRSESGLIHAFDSGIYLQILSNLLAGRGWASSVVQEPLFLAHHFQPVIILLAPLHALSDRTWTLLIVGWASAVGSCVCLIRLLPRYQLASPLASALAALALFLHPTLSSRMYYSFVPEVLALLPLTWLAIQLAHRDLPSARSCGWILLSLITVGLCKENYWLVSSWLAFLFAARSQDKQRRWIFAGCGAFFLGIMLLLFLVWMPEHSQLKTYYGLNYFRQEGMTADTGLGERILGALQNLASVRSLSTALTVLILIPAALLLLGNLWTTLATLPTLGLVMAASNDQIHDLTNHYLLAALPFLAVSTATGWDRLMMHVKQPKLQFYGALLVVLLPAAFTFMHHSGWIFQLMFATERMDFRVRAAAELLKKELTPESRILIDGNLQPFFHDFPHVRVIQAFQGNPSPLTEADREEATDVITANDLGGLERCDDLQSDSSGLVRFDTEVFLAYCRWLKSKTYERREYLPDRLLHLKIK